MRVLDFGWVVAMPLAAAWLGALGADVVRVESMTRPDPARFLAPAPGAPPGPDSSPYFNNVNFSKRSLALDLNRPEARDVVMRLLPRFDVVLENFTVGHLEAWGLGYERLCERRGDVILVSATPLGQTGPEAACVGWGPNTQAWAGLSAVTGYEDGAPSGVGGTWPDFTAAAAIALAVLSALRHRERTGRGQRIDLALAEIVLVMLPEAFLELGLTGADPARRGNRDPRHCPHGVHRCRGEDEWLAVAVETEEEWRALARAIGREAWADDPGFSSAPARRRRESEIEGAIAGWARARDARSAMEVLQSAGVPALEVFHTIGSLDDAQFRARDRLVTVDHPVTGARPILGLPGRFAGFRYRYRPAPRLGADSEAVLGELAGMSAAEVARLRAAKVVF